VVKQFHPERQYSSSDAEESFQRVLKAWKSIKNLNQAR